jgi:hemerythrin superfamily protein
MPAAAEDIVDSLLAQHQQIKVLFAQVDSARGEHKEQLFHELVGLLAVHESVEETLVHPMAEDKLDDGEEVVGARLAEEQEAKEALARLYDLGVTHPDFPTELASLRDAVTAHAEAEEELEFQRLREVVEPAKLQQMTEAMSAAAALSPTRPHPDAPSGPAANVLLGPPLAVFDRVRDALRDAAKGKS